MAIRRKKEGEYHTGRLNISCNPATKDSIAADATAAGKSISQFMLDMYEQGKKVGTSEHMARMGLEMLGLKKSLVGIETQLRRHLSRSQNLTDKKVVDDLIRLKELEAQIDATLRETVEAVKMLKAGGK